MNSKAVFSAFIGWGMACASVAASAEDLPTVSLTIRDGTLQPATLEAPALRRFRIVVRNEGPGPAEIECRSLRLEKVLAPGASSFIVVAPQKPGEYDVFDEFHPRTGKGRILIR